MSFWGWLILCFAGGFIWGFKNWSKLKRIVSIFVVYIICTFIFGSGGSSNVYYQKGYEYGFERGKKDERYGNAYETQTDQLNNSRYNFFRKYTFDSDDEKEDALKNYMKGYHKGYKDGWED